MTQSAGDLGHRPDTNLQEHVRDSSAASLDIVSEVEKMTLTNKFVLVLKYIPNIRSLSPLFCATADIEENWVSVISHQLSVIQTDVHLHKHIAGFLQTSAHNAKMH